MGRNGVKSVTAICTPLLARVRALRYGFTTVNTGIRALGPGDNGFLKSSFSPSCWIADSTGIQSSALGPGDNRLHRRTCTDCEFTPITRITRIHRGISTSWLGERPESCTRYFNLVAPCDTFFLNVPTPPTRDKAFKYNDESRRPSRRVSAKPIPPTHHTTKRDLYHLQGDLPSHCMHHHTTTTPKRGTINVTCHKPKPPPIHDTLTFGLDIGQPKPSPYTLTFEPHQAQHHKRSSCSRSPHGPSRLAKRDLPFLTRSPLSKSLVITFPPPRPKRALTHSLAHQTETHHALPSIPVSRFLQMCTMPHFLKENQCRGKWVRHHVGPMPRPVPTAPPFAPVTCPCGTEPENQT
ncbi:hypothetical protein PIB30_041420 [Stylosanthes scabra]|uniref:Uncharacterized protein n=1 Tax=Stylosanthes scabra TaxID=79078 RepID=A0ABU6VCW7_9FABA|nr:hypothetical protein [Stylosanthes scabra]